MNSEVHGSQGGGTLGGVGAVERDSARPFGPTDAPQRELRMVDGRSEDRHVWAIAALVFPLVFCAIVGVGVFLMFHRDMGYFKPAPSGSAAPWQTGDHPVQRA